MITLSRLITYAAKLIILLCGILATLLFLMRGPTSPPSQKFLPSPSTSPLVGHVLEQGGLAKNKDQTDQMADQESVDVGPNVGEAAQNPPDHAELREQLFRGINTKPPINPHNFKFIIKEETLCTGKRSDIFVLNIVHTAPSNHQRRMLIRETWGNPKLYSTSKMVSLFTIGATKNPRTQQALFQESDRFHDIIQEDFLDSYKNLTYKAIMWLKWTSTYCPNAQYIVKTDDDIFVNVFNLIQHLRHLYKHSIGHQRTLLCLVWNGMPVLRDPHSKWYISKDEYPNEYFSTYCSGSAYILTRDIVFPMYQNSFNQKFFWVDDFYATGVLPRGLNISYHSLQSLYVLKPNEIEKNLVNGYALFGHVGSLRTRHKFWRQVLKLRGITDW